MTAFPALSDQNIDDILYYTTVGELQKPVEAAVAALKEVLSGGCAPSWVIFILAAAISCCFYYDCFFIKTSQRVKRKEETRSNIRS